MADNEKEQETSQRRVYVLPNDLVDRIVDFQKSQRLSSEVEAARRLLDEALMRRDDIYTIYDRCDRMLNKNVFIPDIVRAVLVGHPLVQSVNFEGDAVNFCLINGDNGRLSRSQGVEMWDSGGNKLAPDIPF